MTGDYTPPILVFYEVHHWPHEGRIALIDKAAHRAAPVVTWLQVAGVDGGQRGDATVVIAHTLGAGAGLDGPEATVVLHDRHGNMLATSGGLGLPAVVLRRAGATVGVRR